MPPASPALPSAAALDGAFADIWPALSEDEALAEANRCLYCWDAPCTAACPTRIDVPSFIKKIATGNLRGSARVIFEANPMGYSCARGCPVEVLCEGACVLAALHHRPIAIGRLQRHATEPVVRDGARLFEPGAPTGKRVAIVGAGPAGLSAARELRRTGHAVVVLDARAEPGGLGTYGIAEYKMRRADAVLDARAVVAMGVDLRGGVTVGRDPSFADLLRDHDAVLLAVGLGATQPLGIPGEDLPGVVDALGFIESIKTLPYRDVRVGRRVVVVGGGNTAVDAATQAKRLGAERVTILYRRSEAEMPAYRFEYDLAKRDGCEWRWLVAPTRILGDGSVEGVECVRMELGAPDASGRRAPRPIAGSEHVVEADMVVKSLGQTRRDDVLALLPGLRLDRGRVAVDPDTGATNIPRLFAAGDCTNGGKEIVNAAAEGKRAARGIEALLTT